MNEQSTTKKCIALRMERQHLLTPANETEYDALYRKPLKNATMTQAFYHGKRRSSPRANRKFRCAAAKIYGGEAVKSVGLVRSQAEVILCKALRSVLPIGKTCPPSNTSRAQR